ncbi:MAG: hypothetical protein J0L85_07055 [Zoogloea sp.]|nr:hypothetical protein [Zoogloea sp.]MCA0185660.1 hypothetical protein [Pseudomonadota bacterium]
MHNDAATRFTLPSPLTGWPLAVLLAVYLLVGTTGHLPWRGDDLTHLGPIHAMLGGEGWLLPEIAGEIYRDAGPLYYWLGAGLASALGWLMPVHDAARLASSLFCAATLYWTALAARRLYGESAFAPAILLGMGSLGLVVHAHETQPALAQIAGVALCLAGTVNIGRQGLQAGLQAGLGIALAFLAGGLSGLVLTLPIVLAAPLLCPSCRTPAVLKRIAFGCGIALLITALWLTGVALQAPDEPARWLQEELRSIRPHTEHLANLGKLLQLFGWFAWPLWPIAGWALWKNRPTWTTPQVAVPLIASLSAILLVATTGSGLRPAGALPLLPPLCLLAALGVQSLRRGAANAFDWFGVMAFLFFGLLVWLVWGALHFSWPPGLARQIIKLAPEFPRGDFLASAVIGIPITLALLMLPAATERTPTRGTTTWALGMTLLWCLAVALLQPWFAYTKNYQPIASSLQEALATQPASCIKRRGLGDTQRAALDYFSDIRTLRYGARDDCQLLLTYGTANNSSNVAREWGLPVWERRLGGGRKAEVFRLYRKS